MEYLKKRLIDYLNTIKGDISEKITCAKWHGEFLHILANYFRVYVFPDCPEANAVGGIDVHAGSIAPALAVSNYICHYGPLHSVILRSADKKHGLKGRVLNHLISDDEELKLIIVHDLLDNRSDQSLFKACRVFVEDGYKIEMVVPLIQNEARRMLACNLKDNFRAVLRPIILTSELD